MSSNEKERSTASPSEDGAPRDRWLEALFRLSGSRPAVPADRAQRVRANVRAHWRASVSHRPWRRRVWGIGALVATAAGIVAVGMLLRTPPAPEPQAAPVGRVATVVHPAWTTSGDAVPPATSLRAGDAVPVGAVIDTGGTGRLAIRLGTGHSVRLDSDTRVSVIGERTLTLVRGAVYVDTGDRGSAAGTIEIRTPMGRITDLGTQFEVRLSPATVRVRVREGLVRLDHRSRALEVRAGREVEVDEQGVARDGDLPVTGAEWAWTETIAPMMEIQGRPLRDFLDWIGRERGLRLQFQSVELERSAGVILLNGSLEGLTLDQALESVLATCGMRHRTDGDVLVVETATG